MSSAFDAPRRAPGTRPDPARPAGSADPSLPFDHVIVVMMENHSFDNLLGALPIYGQPQADGLTFVDGSPIDTNPFSLTDPDSGVVRAYELETTIEADGITQTWNATHAQIDGGSMRGFVAAAQGRRQPMGYYTPQHLPFAYSLANAYAVANRWFCSAPCQTYPNRRFLMAGTAYGEVATRFPDPLTTKPPPNGTIFDQLTAHGISWRNYFTDVPSTVIIPSIYERHAAHLRPMAEFVRDCRNGTLPSFSLVDPGLGLVSDVGRFLAEHPYTEELGRWLEPFGGTEEAPQDVAFGERWAWEVIRHVTHSPAWPRTLLIYLYDEHGGYYDHVPPPAAIPPDDIPPQLAPGDAPGGYDIYGPRVPAIIVSPYARPHSVSDTVHDHTSVLATVEAKWNLPALTYRDANAHPVWDLLDFRTPALLDPPVLERPPGMARETFLDLFRIPHPLGGRRPHSLPRRTLKLPPEPGSAGPQ